MKNSIKHTITYDFPVEAVWKAITNKEAMSEWLMPCDIEPIVGCKFQFKTKPSPGFNGIVNCEVLEVIENELLSFSWEGGTLKNTLVTFRLAPNGNKTTLHFEHSGFKGVFNQLIVKKILSNGWKKKILTTLLPKYISKHE